MAIEAEIRLKPNKGVVIRQVWKSNLEYEFGLIRECLYDYPFVSMDTEFPGVIYRPPVPHHMANLRPSDAYAFLKSNVDELHLIQVGLTLSDAYGNLPDLGSEDKFIWEFNFCDFDVERDPHAPDSIHLLRQHGIDLERNRKEGVESERFADLMILSELVCNYSLTWVTFHSAYDFGYLIKILTRRPLPSSLDQFLEEVRLFFGNRVYDIKHMMKFCNGLYGGLDRLANTLHLDRTVGKSHQAGSDSFLTWQAFLKIVHLYFANAEPWQYAGVLYGLELYY